MSGDLTMLTDSTKRKGKKITMIPETSGPGNGARRQMDELLIQVWSERFNLQDEHIAELTRTVRGFNGTPGIMERLGKIETSQAEQSRMITDLGETIDAIHVLLTTIPKPEPVSDDKKGLTKDQLAALVLGLMKPVLTALIIWVMLTFFPDLIKHLGIP